MINSVKPLGNLINDRREKEKKFKTAKKSKGFDKYLEQVFDEQNKESPKK